MNTIKIDCERREDANSVYMMALGAWFAAKTYGHRFTYAGCGILTIQITSDSENLLSLIETELSNFPNIKVTHL